jgi:hypothetical protein
MKYVALLLALVVAGCDSADSGPGLHYRNFGIAGSGFPFIFALRLANDSKEPITVVHVAAEVTHNSLMYDPADADRIPPKFSHRVAMLDKYGEAIGPGQGYTIAAGKTVNLPCEFVWHTGDNPPTMVTVVRASFVVSYLERGSLEVKPFVLVLQSREGALEATAADTDPERAAEWVDLLGQIEGERSAGFRRLLKLLGDVAGSKE